MTGPNCLFDTFVDFYQSEYASAIRRVTPLPFATLLEVEQTAGDWSDAPTADLVFACIDQGSRSYSVDVGAGRFNGRIQPNLTLLTAPDTPTSIQCTGQHSLRIVALPYAHLKSVVGDDLRLPDDGDFGAMHTGMLVNPLFGQMIGAMFDVADPGDPAASLFLESTLHSLAAMLAIEAGKPVLKQVYRGGLADWQVKRTTEALSGGYGNFDLTTLADSVGLSPYHFARAFKQSTGLPPHRYQIMLRIERAKDLLANSALPISDVAAAVGYDDQGQLARLFRREVGVTPSRYRQERRA
jgi:AraC family transcriptional regulator